MRDALAGVFSCESYLKRGKQAVRFVGQETQQSDIIMYTKEEGKKKRTLVAYFSHTGENYSVGNIEKGNTRIVAEMIAAQTGGTLFEIKATEPYPSDYKLCVEQARKEKAERMRPELGADIAIEHFDIIFLGFPNWCSDMPMAVYSFIEKHSWNDKLIAPFCTHEGSGLSSIESLLDKTCKGAKIAKGLAVYGSLAQNSPNRAGESVTAWLESL